MSRSYVTLPDYLIRSGLSDGRPLPAVYLWLKGSRPVKLGSVALQDTEVRVSYYSTDDATKFSWVVPSIYEVLSIDLQPLPFHRGFRNPLFRVTIHANVVATPF